MAPFAHRLANVIALLPAVHAVLGGVLALLEIDVRRFERVFGAQPALEILKYLRNVIIERGPGQARIRGELGVRAHRRAPALQQLVAAFTEMFRKRRDGRANEVMVIGPIQGEAEAGRFSPRKCLSRRGNCGAGRKVTYPVKSARSADGTRVA